MKNNKTIVFILFAIVAFTIYYNSLSSSFHFDDTEIIGNANIMISDLSYDSLKNAAFSNKDKLRAVSYLSFAVNYYFGEQNPVHYRIINVIIHIVNAFLIYLIILKIFSPTPSSPPLKGGDEGKPPSGAPALRHACHGRGTVFGDDDETRKRLMISAFFTALIWLVTPLNSMAVIYIVQRMTLLMTLFFLLSFLAYIIARKSARAPSWFLLSFVFFVISVMSKENGITVILVIILYEFIFNKKGDIKDVTKRELIVLLTLFVILLMPVIVYRSAIYNNFTTEYKRWGFSLGERYLTQCRVLIFGLSLLLLPLPQRLSIIHDIAVSKSLFFPITTLPAIFLMMFLLVFSVLRMKRNPYFSFALLFFFATISVETIMPIELFYEHRMYLPEIFLIGVAVDFIVSRYYNEYKKFVVSAFLIIAILFSVLTVVRGKAWATGLTLWSDTLNKYPNNNRAVFYLGVTYSQKGDYKKALEYYEKALDMELKSHGDENHSEIAGIYLNIGMIWYNLRDYKKTVEYSEKSLALNLKTYGGEDFPQVAGAYVNIGVAWYALGDYAKALQYFEKAYSIDVKLLGSEHLDTQMVKKNIDMAKEKTSANP